MTMLEKAARALVEDWNENGWGAKSSWESLDDQQKKYALGQARSVLMAVREPDETSRQSAKCAADPDWLLSGEAAGKVFTVMIDAILNEEPSNG